MRILKRAAVATAFAALLLAPAAHAVPNLGPYVNSAPFISNGGDITVWFLYNDAWNNNRLFAFVGGVQDGAFVIDVPAGTKTGSPLPVQILGTTLGQQITFLICTSAGTPNGIPTCTNDGFPTGWWSGNGVGGGVGTVGYNSDGQLHAAQVSAAFWNAEVAFLGADSYTAPAGTIVFGFEDQSLGDADYNDLVFAIEGVSTVVPEPATMVLLATGLIGLAGAGVVRRRKDRK